LQFFARQKIRKSFSSEANYILIKINFYFQIDKKVPLFFSATARISIENRVEDLLGELNSTA
tara:strand:- start:36 stop:221 length:186 start_codon:yes stop_codon:yes gene_type:complete